MNLYNITKQLIPTLFIFTSITGTILFTHLYLTDEVASPQWALLFALVGILAILFIIFDKRHTKKQPDITTTKKTNPSILRILDILFYIGLSILLISLITNEIRSFPYIILLSLLTVTITASALLSSDKNVINHALIKTIILFGTASLSIFKIFYWTGRDTWTHAAWNYQLAQDGFLFAGLGKELETPLYHVAVAITEILPGIDVRAATIAAVTIPLIILFSLGIFIVAHSIIGPQYAVLAVIIADFIGIVPYWSSWGQSTTYACMVFAIMLAPLFKLLSEKRTGHTGKWLALFSLFALTIALTHLYSTFILAMYLGGVLLAWFVDVFLNRKISLIPALSAIGGLIIAGGYAVVTNLSFMLPVFQNGLNKLLGKYETPEEPPTGTDEPVAPPISDEPLPGTDTPILPDTGIIDTIMSTDFTALIQSCFTVIEPSIWPSLLSGGLRYALLLIPLVLGCLFVTKHCFKPNVHGFKRSMWYLLVPALMIFFLLFVTTFAYPPMTDRPHYYLPIFLGLVLASIIWWYVTREGEVKHISHSSLWTILLIVFLVVSFGTLSTMEEKAGLFESETLNHGHYDTEIAGSNTLITTIPNNTNIYTDFEMKYLLNYVNSITRAEKTTKYQFLDSYSCNGESGYLVLKQSLIGEATTSYTKYGNSELEQTWYNYAISPEYSPINDGINPRIYNNGDILIWEL